MIVVQLTDCPASLRGQLTQWLLEISAGVFVGQVSARVRDNLWEHIVQTKGRAVLVYSTNNEQRLDFRVHGETWEPIDFDGIKLMLRPSASRLKLRQEQIAKKTGFSNASKIRTAKQFNKPKASVIKYPTSYVVIDIETTGLNPETCHMIEIGAIKVIDGQKTESFHSLILIDDVIPAAIQKMTGITDQILKDTGKNSKDVMDGFLDFIGTMPLVGHNILFDKGFIVKALQRNDLPPMGNRCIDTLDIARRTIKGLSDYKLQTLKACFEIEEENVHRSMADCEVIYQLYQKLINFANDR